MTRVNINKIFNRLFIAASIAALFVVLGIMSFFNRQLAGSAEQGGFSEDVYVSLGEGLEPQDPYITRGPAAEDLLLRPIIDGRDPQIGPDDAKVTIIEFSDFSCKACAEQDSIIKEVMDKYQGKVRLIWKDMPDIGTVSYQAALAARCAQEQGKFWQVHDFLFSDPEAFSAPLDKVVESTGLDASSFISCFSKAKFDGDIKRNLKEASALRLPGVPFFFVGDQEYLGAIDREDLERVIEQGL
jgi:predicted DsbA family dithiol-disulfide isomerase